jgi:hypothetical protein
MKIPPYPPLVKGEWGDFHINHSGGLIDFGLNGANSLQLISRLLRLHAFYPQNVELNEDAGFQFGINDVISKVIMI